MKNSSWNGASLNFLCIPLGEGSCSIGGNGEMCLWSLRRWDYVKALRVFSSTHPQPFLFAGNFTAPVLLQLGWKPQRGQKGNKDLRKIPNLLQALCYFVHLNLVPHNSIAQEGLFGLPSNGKHDLELPRAVPSSTAWRESPPLLP